MSAFTHNFNLGFFHGMFNGMFGGFGAFNWGCLNFRPSFFAPSYNLYSTIGYQSPVTMGASIFSYNDSSLLGLDFNTTPQYFDYSTPINTGMSWQNYDYSASQFQTSYYDMGDSFVSSRKKSPKKDKADDDVVVETGTKGYEYTSKISTSEYNQYNELILKYAKEYNVDPNLVKAVIKQESCFKPNARSKRGAMGLMQFMPATAKQYGVSNAYDPEQNIKGGVKLLADLLKKYDGNLKLVLAAYNWGMGNLARKGIDNAPAETRKYITNITNYYNEYKQA